MDAGKKEQEKEEQEGWGGGRLDAFIVAMFPLSVVTADSMTTRLFHSNAFQSARNLMEIF